MRRPVFEQLCGYCHGRGLHVELHTDSRSRGARPEGYRPPIVVELAVTGSGRREFYRAPATLSSLEHAAGLALGRVAT